jgi:hypothetical protein
LKQIRPTTKRGFLLPFSLSLSLSLSKFNQMCVKSFFNCLENCSFFLSLFFYTAHWDCDCWTEIRETEMRWWCSVLVQTDDLSVCVCVSGPFFYFILLLLLLLLLSLLFKFSTTTRRICCVNVTKYYIHSSVLWASLLGWICIQQRITCNPVIETNRKERKTIWEQRLVKSGS